MRIVPASLKAALLISVLGAACTPLAAAPEAAAKPHRSFWDLAQFSWIRLAPREQGAAANLQPAAISAEQLIRILGEVRVQTSDGVEPLFATSELTGLAGAMAEALSLADPGEDLLLLSGHKRGGGFLSSPLAVVARLFVTEAGLNLIVHDARLEVLGRYEPQGDWKKFQHGSRTAAAKVSLTLRGGQGLRGDWLVLPLEPAKAAPAPAQSPAPAAAPVPVASGKSRDTGYYAEQEARLRALKRMREENLLSEAEYQAKREEILKTL